MVARAETIYYAETWAWPPSTSALEEFMSTNHASKVFIRKCKDASISLRKS